jgi:hypothetical protein
MMKGARTGESVRKLWLIVALCLMAVVANAANNEFQTGRLIDIADDERLREGTTVRWAVFTVQVDDIVYTARGRRIRRRTGDPGKGLVVGDQVKVAVDKDELILLNLDGKEMKMKITKRARAQ